ncbi:MAG: DegT/DnrJ/EryC1/StrS family aminotransferase [Rudaea sp.]
MTSPTIQKIAFNNLGRAVEKHGSLLKACIDRVVESGWFILGPEVEKFETEFATYCGAGHAVGLANGTDAIELALRALGVTRGDEVIVAPNAGMYSTTAILSIGAVPVFADVGEESLNIDIDSAAAAITPSTKAIIATHLYGHLAEVEGLAKLCSKNGIALVEDCAQAHGARLADKMSGSFGDAAAFSFYPTKNLGALGDGGLVTCKQPDVAQRVRRLRQYGWESKYRSVEIGRNSRLDELQAAILRALLPHLSASNDRRRKIAARYASVGNDHVNHPRVDTEGYVAHLYVVRSTFRDQLRHFLSAKGIGTDVHYPTLDFDQPALAFLSRNFSTPIARNGCERVLSLPCNPEMTDDEVDYVCEVLHSWTPE